MNRNADAKRQFEAAVFLDPSFENGYELAVIDLNLGDIDSARKVFAEMLSSYGDTATLHMYFGQAYGNSDYQSDAVAEFQKAIAKDPHLAGVHYSLAVAYLASGGDSKLLDTEAELRQEMTISPNDAAAYAALGHLLATRGQGATDQSQAEALLKMSSKLDADNPDCFLYLGQLYADQKRLPEAEAALRRSISLTRDVSRNSFQVQKAHYLLSRLLMQTGDKAGADSELAVSRSLMSQNLSRDQNRLSQYLGENRPSGSKTEFTQPMQASLDNAPKGSESSKLVETFERRMTPAIADSYNNLGAIAGSSRMYAAALIYFKRAAEWEPTLPGLDLNWGRAAFESASYPQAINPLIRYLSTHPDDTDARRMLGLSQYMVRDYSAARMTFEKLSGKRAEEPGVQYAYAESLLRTGEAPAAISILETLEASGQAGPEVPRALVEAYATLGRQLLAEGDAKEAVLNLQKAMKLDPKNAALKESLQEANSKFKRN